jgi:putative NADH-flavin reductase
MGRVPGFRVQRIQGFVAARTSDDYASDVLLRSAVERQFEIVGGTGYTGGNIVREAAARGHALVSISRSAPAEPVPGVRYALGEAEDVAPRVIPDADVVVAALSPRGDLTGRVVKVFRQLARLSAEAGARYLQVGGFSSLRPAPGAARFVEGDLPEQFRGEALEGEATRVLLVEDSPADLDWVFLSPAGTYGSFAPGEHKGRYRVGDEVALFDADGTSNPPSTFSNGPSARR